MSETFLLKRDTYFQKSKYGEWPFPWQDPVWFGIHYRLDSSLTSFLLRYGGDGSVYVGSFRYGRSSGPAVMTYASGDIATGAVSNAF